MHFRYSYELFGYGNSLQPFLPLDNVSTNINSYDMEKPDNNLSYRLPVHKEYNRTAHVLSTDHHLTEEDITLYLLYGVLFLTGTVGNGAVIHMFQFTSRRKQAGARFVVALAVTDFLSSICLPLEGIVMITGRVVNPRDHPRWLLGEVTCYIVPGFAPLFLTTSSWLLTAISFERLR